MGPHDGGGTRVSKKVNQADKITNLVGLGIDPSIVDKLGQAEGHFWETAGFLPIKKRSEFVLMISEAIYYANLAEKSYDPYDKSKPKPFNGGRTFQEWREGHQRVINRIDDILSGAKPLDVFEKQELEKEGIDIWKRKPKTKTKFKLIRGRKHIVTEH